MKDKEIAKGLGFIWCRILHCWGPYKECTLGETYGKKEWKPTTNLEQAVNHIIPKLIEWGYAKGIKEIHWEWRSHDDTGELICVAKVGSYYQYEGYWTDQEGLGQGNNSAEKMAYALCELFLEVIKERQCTKK